MRTAAVGLLSVVVTLGAATAEAEILFPCLDPSECPAGLACNWGLCEDAMAPATGVLFQVSLLGMPDRTGTAGTRWLRERATATLAQIIEQTGFFTVRRQAGSYPVDTMTLFSVLNAGSAYAVASELVQFDGYSGIIRLTLIDAELGVTVAAVGGELAFTASSLDRTLQRWVNDLIRFFTGRPGIMGARIACIRKFEQGVKEVFTLTFGSRETTQITFDRSLALLPSWSVDGRVAYTSYRDGVPKIFLQGVKEPFAAYDGMNTGLEWSRDGSSAAVTLSKDGNPEIYLLEGATGEVRARLTDDPRIDTSPTLSPDGSRIAFCSDREGTPQIFVMNADGSGKERLTWAGSYNTAPDWHPYGPYVAFSGRAGSTFQVFVQNVRTRDVRQLTHGPGDCEDPDWSPDGRLIAFSWSRGQRRNVYVMNADGSNPRRISPDDGVYSSPVWEILPQI